MKSGWIVAVMVTSALVAGCGSESSGDPSAPMKAESGYIVGRVLGSDGKPIAVAQDIALNVEGVSEAGERVNFSPAVKPDGTFRQKLVAGSYRIGRSTVDVKFGDHVFTYDLTPQGELHDKNREANDGITQDFVWNMTGQRTSGTPDPNNHTHWYGMTIGMQFSLYRDDIRQATTAPPAGTTLVFTLKPMTTLVNGQAGQTLTIEREWRPRDITTNDNLNDLPPATYEITGVATLPDGTTKTILLQGPGDYPKFGPAATAVLELDGLLGGMSKPPIAWVLDERR